LKLNFPGKIPIKIKNEEDLVLFSNLLRKENVSPVFYISNVTGQNVELLKTYLNLLPSTNELKGNIDYLTEFYIVDTY
jgi:GTPase